MCRCPDGSGVKSNSLTVELRLKLSGLRTRGESGTRGVAVECVDIARNADGEGGSLVCSSYEELNYFILRVMIIQS